MLVDWLIEKAVSLGTIKEEETETYRYVYSVFLLWISLSAILLAIGFVFGLFKYNLLLLIMYIPLRQYSGGVHVDAVLFCFLITASTDILILLPLFFQLAPTMRNYLPIISALSAVIIFIFAPQQDPNKTLSKNEIKYCRKRSRQLTVIEVIITILLVLFVRDSNWAYVSAASTVWVSINVGVKAIINKHRINKDLRL